MPKPRRSGVFRREGATQIPALLGCVLCVSGCPEAPLCDVKEPLVTADGWSFVAPDEDTIWPAPAGAALCTEEDIQVQSFGADDAVEIDTRFGCGWATVAQPMRSALRAGDEVQARIFYFSQITFPQAQAEVALALDGDIVSSTLVDIPASSGLLAPRITVPRDIEERALAHFHVGNHGDNSWNLIELSRLTQAPCPASP